MKASGLLLAIALLVVAPTLAHADSNTVLSGHVYLEGTKGGIADANVTASSIGETRTGRTDSTGHFVFFGLLAGMYTVSVTHDGYDVCLTTRVAVMPSESEYLTAPMERERPILDAMTRGTAVPGSSSYVIF